MHTPYTYLIKCIPTNTYYYGVSYGRTANPTELWVRYFTSSKLVHGLIEQYGKSAFVFEIRKTFKNIENALNWEKRVLRRMKVDIREDFINVNPGRGYGYACGEKHWAYGKKYTEEHIRNNIEGQKRSPSWGNTPEDHPSRKKLAEQCSDRFKGKKQSEEHIEKRKMFGDKNGMYGKQHSDEHKKNMAILGKKQSLLDDFKGSENLKESVKLRFENGTHPSQMIIQCVHCDRHIKSLGNFKRWHGDNCKEKASR